MASPSTIPSTASPCPGWGIEVDYATDRGGQASPLLAARYFVLREALGHNLLPGGWRLLKEASAQATVAEGCNILDASRGSDGTWKVTSARGLYCCKTPPLARGLPGPSLRLLSTPDCQGRSSAENLSEHDGLAKLCREEAFGS